MATTPASQLAGFIAKFDPAIAKLARQARATLRRHYFSTANELVYDNYNALAIGYSATERVSDVVISLAVGARGINLYFMYGKSLDDPHGLLQGEGNQGAFVRLTDLDVLDDRRIVALIHEAIREGPTPLPRSGRGKLIIKSVSAKQRDRRTGKRR
ncbi:MAG TPA: DUF1801 domain-containing protein [Vicinamibacterales bacterium]|nr:DUF1801 domain-containing protein [Vicinamibacterales bacterium]